MIGGKNGKGKIIMTDTINLDMITMKTIKVWNKLIGRHVEYPDESELTNKETVVMPLDEYLKKNYKTKTHNIKEQSLMMNK